MTKGKNSKRKNTTIESSERSVTEQPVRETQVGPARQQKCSACSSWLDLTKTLETRCWLCGGYQFLDPDELELRKREENLKRKELCCPNPVCPRRVELLPNSERYCGGCGAALEKATVDVWLRKCVEPELIKGRPQLPPSTRSRLIDEARQMGLSTELAEAQLNEEVKRERHAVSIDADTPGEWRLEQSIAQAAGSGDTSATPGVVKAATTEMFLAPNAGQAGSTPTVIVSPRQTEDELKQKEKHLRKKIKVKYGVVIGCTLTFFLFILGVGLRGRSDNVNKTDPTPSPSQPSPTAKLEPTPELWPGMVFIPGGKFLMGRDRKDGGDAYESPSHEVMVDSFYMDAFEVTREEYQKCVDAKVCRPPFGWTGNLFPPNTAQWPVTGVTWSDANNYANWVRKSLPSEEEWEYAASGRQVRRYPWGDNWDVTQANVGAPSLGAVGRYKSHFGLFDMVGNAQEWTTSGWKQYPDKLTYMKTGDRPERLRIIRGGSYQSSPRAATLTYRNALRMHEDLAEENHYEQTGFRCVQHDNQP
jgi:formylglycine-generating enzyme required for sulfatase activity